MDYTSLDQVLNRLRGKYELDDTRYAANTNADATAWNRNMQNRQMNLAEQQRKDNLDAQNQEVDPTDIAALIARGAGAALAIPTGGGSTVAGELLAQIFGSQKKKN